MKTMLQAYSAEMPASSQHCPHKQEVKAYNYFNEVGILLFQTVRYDCPFKDNADKCQSDDCAMRRRGKGFSHRRPSNNNGAGWIYNLNDTRKVLYNLPSLLKEEATVFIAEGEKDADTLNSLGLTATTSVNGAHTKWIRKYNPYFADRHVVIVQDNDEVGEKHAQDIAKNLKAIAASVKIVAPTEGKDVTEWYELETGRYPLFTDAVKDKLKSKFLSIVEATPAWGQKQQDEDLIPPVPFPFDVFPKEFAAIVDVLAAAFSVDAEVVACAMLTVISGALGQSLHVSYKKGNRVPLFLWLMVVGESGSGKTHPLTFLLKPVRDREGGAYQEYRKKLTEYKKALKDSEKSDYMNNVPDEPKMVHSTVSDFTVEALRNIFETSPRGVIIHQDELSGWVMGMNQYKKGVGNDRQHFLELFNCESWKVDRGKDEPRIIANTGAAILGGIQPRVLPRVFDEESLDDGMLQRFLFVFIDDSRPMMLSLQGIEESVESYWAQLVERCYNDLPLEFDKNGQVVSKKIILNDKAKNIFKAFFEDKGALKPKLSYRVRGFLPKLLAFYCLKLAGLLHVLKAFHTKKSKTDTAISGVIDEETMQGVNCTPELGQSA